jgi:DNA-binding NtrC family response regulator
MHGVKTKLLVVGDEARARRNLEIIFTILGFTVRAFPNGSSALDAIRDEIPDVILSDLEMPGMSGFEFLSIVRRRFPSIRVIAMSREFTSTSVPEGVAADAFYEKGRRLRSLLGAVEAMARPGKSLASRFPRVSSRSSVFPQTATFQPVNHTS